MDSSTAAESVSQPVDGAGYEKGTQDPGLRLVEHWTAGPLMPKGLLSAEQAAASVGIPVARLLELAEAGYAPHYRVDGGPPAFGAAELSRWCRANLVDRIDGRDLPRELRLNYFWTGADVEEALLPSAIKPMFGALRLLPGATSADQPCVYFLCLGDEVVYVGQTVQLAGRVYQHRTARKEFDRVVYLPVTAADIDEVERSFIVALRPRMNRAVPAAGEPPAALAPPPLPALATEPPQ